MLLRLTPEQVTGYWAKIRPRLMETLPSFELNPQELINVYNAILVGRMDCWIIVGSPDKDGNKGIIGFIITEIVMSAGGTRNLLIYALWTGGLLTPDVFKDGKAALAAYAKNFNCESIIGYSAKESMIKLARHLGADTSQTVIVYKI